MPRARKNMYQRTIPKTLISTPSIKESIGASKKHEWLVWQHDEPAPHGLLTNHRYPYSLHSTLPNTSVTVDRPWLWLRNIIMTSHVQIIGWYQPHVSLLAAYSELKKILKNVIEIYILTAVRCTCDIFFSYLFILFIYLFLHIYCVSNIYNRYRWVSK